MGNLGMELRSVADQAHECLVSEEAKKYYAKIKSKMVTAAREGKYGITNPFYNIEGMPTPSSDVQKLLIRKFAEEGVEYKHHKNPDPGHPCSSDWDEFTWKR